MSVLRLYVPINKNFIAVIGEEMAIAIWIDHSVKS
jgi:hypothetical protein